MKKDIETITKALSFPRHGAEDAAVEIPALLPAAQLLPDGCFSRILFRRSTMVEE